MVGLWIKKERVGSINWIGVLKYQVPICCLSTKSNCCNLFWLFIALISITLARFTVLTVGWQLVIHSVHTFYYIHSRWSSQSVYVQRGICLYKTNKTSKKMVFGRSLILSGLCLLMLASIGATATTRAPQYGLESIEGFCEGWGELDQLSDISSQLLNAKFPYMGPIRVSW